MIEDLITQLDSLGVDYMEDPETGDLTINLEAIDKATVIDIMIAIQGAGLDFNLDEDTITVYSTGGITPEEEEEELASEDLALDEALGQM